MKWFKWPLHKDAKSRPVPGEKGYDGDGREEPADNSGISDLAVSPRLGDDIKVLKSIFGEQKDIIYRHIRLGAGGSTPACLVYIDGLVNTRVLNDDVIRPLMQFKPDNIKAAKTSRSDSILESVLTAANAVESSSVKQLVAGILSGAVAILTEGLKTALLVDISQHPERAIDEPTTEVIVRGPREGFTETIQTNVTMIRRRIKDPRLRFDIFPIGRVTATDVALVYIEGITSPDLVDEVRQRLRRIDIDGVLESGYLEELIEDQPFSPFPQMHRSERPDRVAASLLEGQVAVLTDGTPFALVMPAQLASFLNSPEDYYERYILSSSLRLLRWAAFAVSLFLPSIYIAVTTFHQEMISPRLLVSIAAYRQGLPFSTLFEALMMELTFEVLREAGIRLPRASGQAVSIAGALVIGQSAVMAGIVSPLMVIIVAATGIASFTVPSYNTGIAIRLFRFPLMLLAGTFGLFGVSVGFIILVIHIANLRSFGVPFLSPLAPLHASSCKDILVRAPWWKMQLRPVEYGKTDPSREAPDLKPGPAQGRPENGGAGHD